MSGFDLKEIVRTVQNVLPEDSNHCLHEPEFTGKEWDYVKDCLDTGIVSSIGEYVNLFENKISDYTGVKHVVAVINGTAALHICLKLVGVGQADEVLVPDVTFVATANAVIYCGASPHFVDSEERTLGLDPYKLSDYLNDIATVKSDGCYNNQTGRRIKALIAVHIFGHPVDMDPVVELCERFKLELVEDAAEALGSSYKNRHMGNLGRVAALSFNGNKVITTGGGGAILTNDEFLAKTARHITTTAKVPHKWAFDHDRVGYNYRLPNINSAIGCAQLEGLAGLLKKKRNLAKRYHKAFNGIEGIKFYTEPENAYSNYWLNAILLDEKYAEYRDDILDHANSEGINMRPLWTLMHKLPMFSECSKMDVSTAESLERRLINIPSSAKLGDDNGQP